MQWFRLVNQLSSSRADVSGPVTPCALSLAPHRTPLQVAVQGNLQLTKYDRFWGEGTTPLPDLPPQGEGPASATGAGVTPLGPLEFVLDPNAHADAAKSSSSGSGSNRQ